MAVSRQLEKKFLNINNIHFWRIYAIFKKGSEKFLFSFDDFPDFFKATKNTYLMKIIFD